VERRNINRGFKRLRVWQDAVTLYIAACNIFLSFPFELRKTASNAIDSAHSINRNIAEGYCRRSIKEYLNLLNIALGSCGELHSSYESFKSAGQISEEQYEKIDQVHFITIQRSGNSVFCFPSFVLEGEFVFAICPSIFHYSNIPFFQGLIYVAKASRGGG
jgi:four helix bundle protein